MYEKVWKKLHSWEFYRNNLYTTYKDRVKTFAEYLGMENNLLEARRKEFYKSFL